MTRSSVSYDRQTYNSPNPIARFAHRSRFKKSLELVDELLGEGGTVVDFGAGDGAFLNSLHAIRPDAIRVGVEPYMTLRYPDIRTVSTIWDVEETSMDVVTALEVCEHLTDDDLDDFLRGAEQALKPEGRLVITVPVMYGPVLPVKEVSRMLLYRRLSDTGPFEMLKASVGIPIDRAQDRLTSHKGFDFRWLRKKIAEYFDITEESYSPSRPLPWWLNSQAIFVAAQK